MVLVAILYVYNKRNDLKASTRKNIFYVATVFIAINAIYFSYSSFTFTIRGMMSQEWKTSQIIEYIKQLPMDVEIYTNDVGMIYLDTRSICKSINCLNKPTGGQPAM